MLSKKDKMFVVIFGLCGAIALASFVAYSSQRPRSSSVSQVAYRVNKSAAWDRAVVSVRNNLRSPASASFGSFFSEYQGPDDHVHYEGNRTYMVGGWVDAQNAYGATVRSHWQVHVRDTGSVWEVVSSPTFSLK